MSKIVKRCRFRLIGLTFFIFAWMPKQAVCNSLQTAVHFLKKQYFVPNWHYRSYAGMLLWVADKCLSGFQESIIVVSSKRAFPFMSHKTGFCKVQSAWGTWSFEKHLSLRHTIKARGPWEDKRRAPYIILCVTAKLRDTHDVGRSITSACNAVKHSSGVYIIMWQRTWGILWLNIIETIRELILICLVLEIKPWRLTSGAVARSNRRYTSAASPLVLQAKARQREHCISLAF